MRGKDIRPHTSKELINVTAFLATDDLTPHREVPHRALADMLILLTAVAIGALIAGCTAAPPGAPITTSAPVAESGATAPIEQATPTARADAQAAPTQSLRWCSAIARLSFTQITNFLQA